jgi:Xaa-Pro aminopeptidase
MSKLKLAPETAQSRIDRVRKAMIKKSTDAVIIPISGDLEWLLGYQAMVLERLTALVITNDSSKMPVLIVPDLALPEVNQMPGIFECKSWGDGENPYEIIHSMFHDQLCETISVGGRMWSQHLIELQKLFASEVETWTTVVDIIGPLRRRKDHDELTALSCAAAAVDAVIKDIQEGRVPLRGRTEKQVAEHLDGLMRKYGHERVDFILVQHGPNAAVPHNMPSDTVIGDGIILFDMGGIINGYHSDCTRCVHVGKPSTEVQAAYDLLQRAQQAAVDAVKPGVPACDIDAACRNLIEAEGAFPGYFIHRTGHGIGMDEHEVPFIGSEYPDPVEAGNTFSIEPGIYVDGKFGMRLEDIVYVTEDGCLRLNQNPRELIVVDA